MGVLWESVAFWVSTNISREFKGIWMDLDLFFGESCQAETTTHGTAISTEKRHVINISFNFKYNRCVLIPALNLKPKLFDANNVVQSE